MRGGGLVGWLRCVFTLSFDIEDDQEESQQGDVPALISLLLFAGIAIPTISIQNAEALGVPWGFGFGFVCLLMGFAVGFRRGVRMGSMLRILCAGLVGAALGITVFDDVEISMWQFFLGYIAFMALVFLAARAWYCPRRGGGAPTDAGQPAGGTLSIGALGTFPRLSAFPQWSDLAESRIANRETRA